MKLTDEEIIVALEAGRFIRNHEWIKGYAIRGQINENGEDIIELFVNGKYVRPYEFSVQELKSDKWSIVNMNTKEVRKLARALSNYCKSISCKNCTFYKGTYEHCTINSPCNWELLGRSSDE